MQIRSVGPLQRRAIAHVAALTDGEPADPSWRVTLHFHPDRLFRGAPILDVLGRDGRYRCQFETGTSNGGLTAHPGGDRWIWESRIFGGAYDDAPAVERPKYGSLDVRGTPVGGSPRFGSAFLRLGAEVMARTTFCYPDSFFRPVHFGVATRLSRLVELAAADDVDPLDHYIEAHVHGPVDLASDVEALVLDPSHRGDVEDAASRLGCPVEFHPGFRLSVDELVRHPSYRGDGPVELGVKLAEDGYLDPAILGAAARTGAHDEVLLKRLWHLLARFGGPVGPAR